MSNVNKPVIPAEVAEVIERYRSLGEDNASIIRSTLHSAPSGTLKSIPFDTLLAALVNGYEREMTEEERKIATIKEAWLVRDNDRCFQYDDGYADGIEFVLTELGIQIEGVNA